MRKYGFKLDIVKDEEFEEAVKEFAKNNPEIAAALIRSMLKERGE
mgnify:CR=1 FL=1